MHSQQLYSDDLTKTIKPRNYKCPCGKTYLSYAALFTHIKQKHQGKPPGKITKPPSIHQKRGRPPVKQSLQKRQQQKSQKGLFLPINHSSIFPPQTEEQKLQREIQAYRAISQLSEFLLTMPHQDLNKQHLNQIQVFCQINVYLNTRLFLKNFVNGNICIADGFIEFAQLVCEKIFWVNFEPFYLLFMLFFQFIIDEQNSKKILTESNMDLFCQFINQFVQDHARQMAQYYQLQNLWIMQKQNTIKVFYNFFIWCTHKRYITYKINLTKQTKNTNKDREILKTFSN